MDHSKKKVTKEISVDFPTKHARRRPSKPVPNTVEQEYRRKEMKTKDPGKRAHGLTASLH